MSRPQTLEEWQARLARLGAGGLKQAIWPELERTAKFIHRVALANAKANFHRRTGELFNSISATAGHDSAGRMQILAVATSRSARLREFGGTVRPKHSRMLAIPLPAALTPGGVPRRASPLRETSKDLRFVKTRRGAFLVRDVGGQKKDGTYKAGSRTEFWFILKSSVRQEPRPFLGPAVDAGAEFIRPRLIAAINKAIRGV